MAYLNTNTRTTKPTSNEQFQGIGRQPALLGVFVGLVKNAEDVQRNGRLQVWIPEFGSAPEEKQGWVTVNYCSPFAGATNVDTISKTDKQSFEGTQTSYGMWMIPPDINNEVLVMFIGGDSSRGVWIGSLYNQFMNNMVPAMAADAKNWQYPGVPVPAAEYNKWDTSVTQPDRAFHPYQKTKFKGVGNQGLIRDQGRGITTSSARREAPSNVFGIITPGPAINDNVPAAQIRRKGGSSFVMDDGTGSEYVQLTTKTGAQIRLDETNGFVYLINRDGTAWVQMDQDGNIDIFGAKNISMRAQQDINIRADRNINIEAGQNIYMKAAKDTVESTTSFTYDVNNIPRPSVIPSWKYVGEGAGTGGNIVMQALNNWHSTTKSNAYITVVDNNLNVDIGNALAITTIAGGQDYSSKMGIKMTTDASYDLAATADIRIGTKGRISAVGLMGVSVCTDGSLSLNAGVDIIETAVGEISMDASRVDIGTHVYMPALDTGSIKSNTVAHDNQKLDGGDPTAPATLNTIPADPAQSAQAAQPAEIKAMVEKINILATWKASVTYPEWAANTSYKAKTIVIYSNLTYISLVAIPPAQSFDLTKWEIYTPEDKFKRDAASLNTTTSRLPTYEPCPEHETFTFAKISGYTPVQTEGEKTYEGSAGSGNPNRKTPATDTTPGANNTDIPTPAPSESAVTKDIDVNALKNQLKVHEGVKYVAYPDLVAPGGICGGVGHLMRQNEKPMYPVGSPISVPQVDTWLDQDIVLAVAGSERLFTIDVWGDLSDIRKRACADLCYNMGAGKLATFRNFVAAMKAGNYTQAGTELRNSVWYGQVGKRGPNIVTMIVQNVDPIPANKNI